MKILGKQDFVQLIDWNNSTARLVVGTTNDENPYDAYIDLDENGLCLLRDRCDALLSARYRDEESLDFEDQQTLVLIVAALEEAVAEGDDA